MCFFSCFVLCLFFVFFMIILFPHWGWVYASINGTIVGSHNSAQSHYLNLYSLIVNGIIGSRFQLESNQNAYIFFQQSEIETVVSVNLTTNSRMHTLSISVEYHNCVRINLTNLFFCASVLVTARKCQPVIYGEWEYNCMTFKIHKSRQNELIL